MAREGAVQNYHSFSNGLVTEGSLLSGNEAVVRYSVNFRFAPTGEAFKRKGLSVEEGTLTPALTPQIFHQGNAQRTVVDINSVEAVGVAGTDIAIIRAGRNLYVAEKGQDPSLRNNTLPVSNTASINLHDMDLEIVNAQNRALVLSPFSVRWLYKDGGIWTLSENLVSTESHDYGGALVRDFDGVNDGLEVDEEPFGLTARHRYNLSNQGWDQEKWNEYQGETGRLPSNSQVWYEARDEDDEFDAELLAKQEFGNSPAPRGRAIISAISLDRRGIFDGVSAGLPAPYPVSESTPYMFTTAAAFGGRVAFSGSQAETVNKKVFISPVLNMLSTPEEFNAEETVIEDDGILVGIFNLGFFWSEDGENFTVVSAPHAHRRKVVYSPELDRFVAIGSNGMAEISNDGKSWVEVLAGGQWLPGDFPEVIPHPTMGFIGRPTAAASSFRVSADGTDWSTSIPHNLPAGASRQKRASLVYNSETELFYSATVDGVWVSSNLSAWSQQALVGRELAFIGISDNGVMIAIENEWTTQHPRRCWISNDGVVWTQAANVTTDGGWHVRNIVDGAFNSETGRWVFVNDTQNPADRRIATCSETGTGWASPTAPGPRLAQAVAWKTTGKYYLGADNSADILSSGDGTNWDTHNILGGACWGLAVKNPTTTSVTTATGQNLFFDKMFRFYQQNDPTAEISNELLADDGLMTEISEADRIVKLASLSNALLVFATNGVWAITGTDVASGFRTDEYMVYKITNHGTRNKDSVVEANNLMYYWSDTGIYAIGMNEMGRLEASGVTEGRLDTFYENVSVPLRRHVLGYYDKFADRVVWAYRDPMISLGPNPDPSERNSLLVLDNKSRGFYIYQLESPGVDHNVSIVGFTQDHNFPRPDGEVPLKLVVETRGQANDSLRVFITEFRDGTFTDYVGLNVDPIQYDAFIETWPDTVDQPHSKKQAVWAYAYMYKTETGFQAGPDGLEPINPSGCMMRGQWDFHNSPAGNKWTQPRQIYRHKRAFTPAVESDTFDTGEEIIETKNKIYGRGSALSLRFDADHGKDCQIVGYTIVYALDSGV